MSYYPINWHKSNSVYWITNSIYIEGLTEINSTETKRLWAQRQSLGLIYLCANSAQHLPPYKISVNQAFTEQLLCRGTSCYQALDTVDAQNLWKDSDGKWVQMMPLKICRCENKDRNQISVAMTSSQITESKTDYSSHLIQGDRMLLSGYVFVFHLPLFCLSFWFF